MADVDEIIGFIKSLRKGFDKDLFQSKIEELAYAVDTTGLAYEDFHTLFKVWLNLSLPITKWVNLGSCLAPPEIIEERTVEYALKWILANFHDQTNSSRVGFLLDWLTVAMDCDCIDMTALDVGYEVFFSMLSFEVLAVHAVKLVYTLTKPMDVTRKKVLEMINIGRKREAQKSALKPLQVLLGLFKSYKPECVPEDIPAIPIYTAFKKPNKNVLDRYKIIQARKDRLSKQRQNLMWINPINCERGRNKKAQPLVPNVEFVHIGRHSDDGETILDMADPASVLQHSIQGPMSRPAKLRAFLCNETGQTLLAIQPHSEHAFLDHHLAELLQFCFLEVSPYSYAEKQDLLHKLAIFQRTLVQGIPVVTTFLAEFLPFWNERDYFPEILELMEWVSAERPDHILQIASRAVAVSLRAPPLYHCALMRSLTSMYNNLVYCSTRTRQHFMNPVPPHAGYEQVLRPLADIIAMMGHKALQVDPADLRIQFSLVLSAHQRARMEKACGAAMGAFPTPLVLALPLLGVSPALIENVVDLLIMYKNMITDKVANEEYITMSSKYVSDLLNCLYSEEALSDRQNGLVFSRLHPQLVNKLTDLMPDVDSKLSLRNHLAFAPYTYIKVHARSLEIDPKDVDNKMVFYSVVEPMFPRLGLLMKKTLPELRDH